MSKIVCLICLIGLLVFICLILAVINDRKDAYLIRKAGNNTFRSVNIIDVGESVYVYSLEDNDFSKYPVWEGVEENSANSN